MNEIKFRAQDTQGVWRLGNIITDGKIPVAIIQQRENPIFQGNATGWCFPVKPETVGQYIGLEDKNGNEYYINDIGEFENGDRFIIKIEDFLQFYIEWIGNPKCEDQGRDLYRIERAERIGNIHQDKHLLK